MSTFLLIASAHFFALLAPGPDFLLITRLAAGNGLRVAASACLGIALANGLFIAIAFAGLDLLKPDTMLFRGLQMAGGAYLLYLALALMRSSKPSSPDAERQLPAHAPRLSWARALGMGGLSALLNPKNALFYGSLASMLASTHTPSLWLWLCGIWMFCVVLAWDLLVAALIGNPWAQRHYHRWLPVVERLCGLLLSLLGLLMLWQGLTPKK